MEGLLGQKLDLSINIQLDPTPESISLCLEPELPLAPRVSRPTSFHCIYPRCTYRDNEHRGPAYKWKKEKTLEEICASLDPHYTESFEAIRKAKHTTAIQDLFHELMKYIMDSKTIFKDHILWHHAGVYFHQSEIHATFESNSDDVFPAGMVAHIAEDYVKEVSKQTSLGSGLD